jgi:hypothetical protein
MGVRERRGVSPTPRDSAGNSFVLFGLSGLGDRQVAHSKPLPHRVLQGKDLAPGSGSSGGLFRLWAQKKAACATVGSIFSLYLYFINLGSFTRRGFGIYFLYSNE